MNKKQYLVLVIFQVIVATSGVSLGAYGGMISHINQHQTTIYDHIQFQGIELGGKNYTEAVELVKENYLKSFLEQPLTFQIEEKKFQISMGELYKPINVEKYIKKILEYPNQLSRTEKIQLLRGKKSFNYVIAPELEPEKIEQFVEQMDSEIKKEGKEATIEVDVQNNIHITSDQAKVDLNKEKLVKKIEEVLKLGKSHTINLQDFIMKTNPAKTAQILGQIDTLIASYSSSFNDEPARKTNITLSAKAIDGIVLLPGETFSFNTIVGDTTAEKGYKEAAIIVNRQMDVGLGGGVCQVSSTLYNAVLRSGLDSVQRQPHSVPLSYVPKGLDATISYGDIDYKFKNTWEWPLYIKSFTEENNIYVQIYSNQALSDNKYKLTSETYEVIPSPVEYIRDSSLEKDKKELMEKGRVGYKVKVVREQYNKGELVGTETVSMDTYRPSKSYYKIGVKP